MFTATFDTPNDMYPEVVAAVMESGVPVDIDRPEAVDKATRELNPCIFTLNDPSNRLVTSRGRPVNVAFALAEVLWILAGRKDVEMLAFYNSNVAQFSDDGETFNAAYGYRLRHSFGVDQIEDVIRTLRDDRSSRQATLVISNPVDDKGWDKFPSHNGGVGDWVYSKHKTKDRACNLLSHMMIRRGHLNWLHVVRSNDAVWGVPYNLMQFLHLQEWIATSLGVPIGTFTYVANSMHIYEHHFAEAERIGHFDLYEQLGGGGHVPFRVGDEVLNVLLREELALREGETPTEPSAALLDPLGAYWHSALRLWYAHALYRLGRDQECVEQLLFDGEPILGAAQARFYYQNRWYKEDHAEVVALIRTDTATEVADWITTRVED